MPRSLTLSQFNTDNVIRQLELDILSVACGLVMVLLLRQNTRPIAWNRWGQNVVLPVNSARATSSVSWFVRLGSSAADKVQLKKSADTRISTDAETQRGRAQIGRCNSSKV